MTIRALGLYGYGGPEVLVPVEVPRPSLPPGHVRIRVAAVSVNPADVLLREGGLAGRLVDAARPIVPGLELSGWVEETAGGTSRWSVGDAVCAVTSPLPSGCGAYAEEVVVREGCLAAAPTGASMIEAATLAMNGLTAMLALDAANVASEQTIAVTGAAGAVGGFVTQLAKLRGARVVACAGAADETLVRDELGADEFVARGPNTAEHLAAATAGRADVLVDAARIGPELLSAVRDGGVVVDVRPAPWPLERDIRLACPTVSARGESPCALDALSRLASAGLLALRVADTFAPEDAAAAHARLSAGGVRGRLVLVFREDAA